jgi:hypothetical protein
MAPLDVGNNLLASIPAQPPDAKVVLAVSTASSTTIDYMGPDSLSTLFMIVDMATALVLPLHTGILYEDNDKVEKVIKNGKSV